MASRSMSHDVAFESGAFKLLVDLAPYALGFACARALIILISYDGYLHSDAGITTEGISLLIVVTLLAVITMMKLLKIKQISPQKLHQANIMHAVVGVVSLFALTVFWAMITDPSTHAQTPGYSFFYGVGQVLSASSDLFKPVVVPARAAASSVSAAFAFTKPLSAMVLFFKYAVSVCSIWFLFTWIRSVKGSSPHVILSFVLTGVILSELIIYPISFLSLPMQHLACLFLLVIPVVLHRVLMKTEPLDEKYPYVLGTSLLSSQETMTNVSYLISMTVGIAVLAIPVGMARGFPGGDPIAFTTTTKSIYVVLIIVLSLAWFIYDVLTKCKGNRVAGVWIVSQLLVALSALLYVVFPDRLDFGAIFATVANVYLLIMLWHTEGVLFTVGRHSMIVYFTCCYSAYMIPRALGRLVVSQIYQWTQSSMVIAALIFMFTLMSAQLIFAYLLVSRARIINRINDACPVADTLSVTYGALKQGISSQTTAGDIPADFSPAHLSAQLAQSDKTTPFFQPERLHSGVQALRAQKASVPAPLSIASACGSMQVDGIETMTGSRVESTLSPQVLQKTESACKPVFSQPEMEKTNAYKKIEVLFGLESCVEGPLDERISVLQHSIAKIGKRFQLSEREMQVLTFFALGYTQKRVAETLNLSPGTVHSHIKRIYDKTDFHSRQDVLSFIELQNKES